MSPLGLSTSSEPNSTSLQKRSPRSAQTEGTQARRVYVDAGAAHGGLTTPRSVVGTGVERMRQHWFKSPAEALLVIEDWPLDYNHVRLHGERGRMASLESLLQKKHYPRSHSE